MADTLSPVEVKIAITPDPPSFATAAEERLHRKQRLASAFRLFAKFGFSEGVAGHITARDPELTDHFWVNPFGMHFAHVRVSDLVLVNELGEVVEGNRPINEAAFAIHSRLHMAPPRRRRSGACPFALWKNLVHAGPVARPAHAGCLRLLRRSQPL